MFRICGIILVVVLFSTLCYSQYTDKYDHHFKKYSKQYFMGIYDWEWFKAQGIAESNLDSDVISWAGAQGIMQIMPFTGKDIGLTFPFDAKMNIEKGIYYDRKMWRVWKSPPTYFEKLYFTFASYNAGLGHIINAQKKAIELNKDTTIWESNVEEGLPYITGDHSKETRDYVNRIKRIYAKLRKAIINE